MHEIFAAFNITEHNRNSLKFDIQFNVKDYKVWLALSTNLSQVSMKVDRFSCLFGDSYHV